MIGRSIGGGVAVAMAAEQGARALVLENTFTKMTDAAVAPVSLAAGAAGDAEPLQLAPPHPQLPRPGVPMPRHGRRNRADRAGPELFEAAPTEFKHFHEIPFARHNDGLPPKYYAALCGVPRPGRRSGSNCRPRIAGEAATGVVVADCCAGVAEQAPPLIVAFPRADGRIAVSAVWPILV